MIVDDFLAKGMALLGLIDICSQAGSQVVGAGIVIEKAFQDGGKIIRQKGIKLESLARIAAMDDTNIIFD